MKVDFDELASRFIRVEVCDPVVVVSSWGMRSTLFTVKLETNHWAFSTRFTSTQRTYNDFCWLHRTIQANFPTLVLPSLPPKRTLTVNKYSETFLTERCCGLTKFLKKLMKSPTFLSHRALHLFLETTLSTAEMTKHIEGHSTMECCTPPKQTTAATETKKKSVSPSVTSMNARTRSITSINSSDSSLSTTPSSSPSPSCLSSTSLPSSSPLLTDANFASVMNSRVDEVARSVESESDLFGDEQDDDDDDDDMVTITAYVRVPRHSVQHNELEKEIRNSPHLRFVHPYSRSLIDLPQQCTN